MPIPERFRLKKATKRLVEEMCALCDQIEDELELGGDAHGLLVEWHVHAGRECEPHEFANYWRSMNQEEFVREALNPVPTRQEDISYAEVLAVTQAIMAGELKESERSYYLSWLEIQFADSNISDLIYWPDHWFGDASLFRDETGAFKPEVELNADQIVAYAMEKSGRRLDDRPDDVVMPFPLP